MLQRPRHTLTLAAVCAASLATIGAGALGAGAASAAPGTPATTARSGPAFGHTPPALRSTATGTASTRMAAAYGGYPLHVTTLTTKVLLPLQLSVSARRGILVADSATGLLTRIGQKAPVVVGPRGGEIAGVDVDRAGNLAYTFSDPKAKVTGLRILGARHGKVTANLSAFEARHNPDAGVTYGIDKPTDCQVAAFKDLGGANYTGLVDSHPYAVTAVPGGWVVAEAAGNDLLLVDGRGRVSLLARLPRQPHTITAAEAKALGLPSCVAGAVYNFEPVPTDVELGAGGLLYVTTLPGGPEGPALGARGSVYRLTLRGRHLTRLATGFAGATNLALTPSGRVLVAELFAGRISTIERGRPSTVIALPQVASVEFSGHAIYAGTSANLTDKGISGHGSVVRVDVRW